MKNAKKFAALLVVAAGFVLPGCTTGLGGWGDGVAYSNNDRGQMIARNWDIEGRQAIDDLDHALLLRPASQLSIWHTRTPY